MRAHRRAALAAMLPSSTGEWRDAQVAFFAHRGGWVPLDDFIAEFSAYLTPGQGSADLAVLVKAGRLEVRNAPDGSRTRRGFPRREYRVPA